MEGEKFIKVDDVEYKCVFFYGYNDKYYATIYDNNDGRYVGQLENVRTTICSDLLKNKICTLLENN